MLLKPWIKYQIANVKVKNNVMPIETIGMKVYGLMDGKSIIEHVIGVLSDE